MDSQPDAEVALPRAIDLHRRIRATATGVMLLSRIGALAMVGLSIAALAQADGYTNKAVAAAVYLIVALWSMVFLALIAVRDPILCRALAADIAVTAVVVAVLPWTLRDDAFATGAVPDFEPVAVSAAVTVALATASWAATAATCLTLAAAFAAAEFAAFATANVASTMNIVAFQAVTAACRCVFIRRLRAVATTVDVTTGQVIAARRSQAEQRIRPSRCSVKAGGTHIGRTHW